MAWFNNDGIRLRFLDEGHKDAVPVILLHEIGMCLEAWDYLANSLVDDFRVLRMDLRSHGLSHSISDVPKMEHLVSDVKALIKHSGISQPVILCGAAVGGAIALSFAADFPKLTKAVIASSPATGVKDEAREQAHKTADAISVNGFEAVLGDLGFEQLFPPECRDNPELFKAFLNISFSTDKQVIANYLHMVADLDIQSKLNTIKVPVQLLGGKFDAMRPALVVEQLSSSIETVRYKCIDSGHYASLQAPNALLDIIKSQNSVLL